MSKKAAKNVDSDGMAMWTSVSPLKNYTEVFDFVDLVNERNATKNITEEEWTYIPFSERPETYFVPVIFTFIFIIGITGNGALSYTILRHKSMRDVPNTYVLSLAVGDLLVLLIGLPFTMSIYVTESWPFGLLICQISECVKDISVAVSVFTLTALAADRYFAIVDPIQKLHVTGGRRQATHCTVAVVMMIWILAVICAIPALFSYLRCFETASNMTYYVCYPFPVEYGPNYPKVIITSRFFINYVIPLCIIGVFYVLMARYLICSTKNIPGELLGQAKQVQSRKKVAKMVITFVIVFAICFLPQHVFMLWFYYNPSREEDYNYFWHYFRILGFCLAYTNSCINPIALYCVSGTFRHYFDRYLFCWIGKKTQNRKRLSDVSSRDTRREQRELLHLTIAEDIRPSSKMKHQGTITAFNA